MRTFREDEDDMRTEREAHRSMGGRTHQAERALAKDEESASLGMRVPLSIHTKASAAQELMFPDTRPLISCLNPPPHLTQQPPGSHVGGHKGSPGPREFITIEIMYHLWQV